MKKITFNERLEIFKELNENKYEFIKLPLQWRDIVVIKCKKCGNIMERRADSALKDYHIVKNCNSCEIKIKGKPYTYKEVYEVFKSRGYELLEDTYTNCKDKLKYKCNNCGEINYMSFDNMKRFRECPSCVYDKKMELKIKEKTNMLGFEIISIQKNKYFDRVLKLKCNKNHKFEVLWSTLSKLKKYKCKVCRGLSGGMDGKKSYSQIKEEIENYIKENNLNYKFINLFYEEGNGKLKKIPKLTLNCEKHGNFTLNKTSFTSNRIKQRCPICSLNMSKGEREIFKILNENNISFISQKVFKECKNKLMLPFDFYLDKLNIIIEYNGKEHYEAIKFFGGENKFLDRIRNDNIKREYCKNNSIKLIEIPYWEFKNIEEIIKIEVIKNE